MKENCHYSRNSDDIEMNLLPVTKLDKKNKTMLKNLAMTSCQQIVASLFFSNLWPIWSNPEGEFWTHSL